MAPKPQQDTMRSSKPQPTGAAPRILIISDDKNNDLELFYPYYRFSEAGARVKIASPAGEEIKGSHSFTLKPDLRVADAKPADFDLLYLPGGQAPAKLRQDENVLKFVRDFVATGKPIAAICHGAQILASADVIRGSRLAAWPEVEDEIKEAGGTFVNLPLVQDGQFITARWPGDLPGHLEAVMKTLTTAGQSAGRQSAA
jgi:protease I